MNKILVMDVSHLYSTYDLGADPKDAEDLPLNSGNALAYYVQIDDGEPQYVITKWSDGKLVEDYLLDLIPERAKTSTDLSMIKVVGNWLLRREDVPSN